MGKHRILFIGLLLFIIISCKENRKISIGFMIPNLQDARYAIDRDNFTKKAIELGAEVLVTNAENDDNKQINQAKELLERDVDALVIIAVNQTTAAAIAREARNKKIKVIAYERLIKNCDLDLFIGFNHYQAGQLMAEYATKVKPTGNYVIICGDKTDKNAELIMQGYDNILNPFISDKKINKIFNTYVEDWSAENAYIIMKKILNYFPESVDVVLCANDGMAGGVINALNEKGLRGKVLVTGMDAELSACKRIVEGSQNITIYKPMNIQGITAAENTLKIIKGEEVKYNEQVYNGKMHVPAIILKPTVVDIKNIKETIVADRFYKEEEIFSEN